jgi:predicted component of type VI protein secretion system
MLFHVTIGHAAQDCPGRHPTDPPALVAPSDTREKLGTELNVKLRFVLWGAACMLWAQPDHLAFAVLEADDIESGLQYVKALVPEDWTFSALPVWNLPSQLRLIRQVRLAPAVDFAEPSESLLAGPRSREPTATNPAPAGDAGSATSIATPTDRQTTLGSRSAPVPAAPQSVPGDDQPVANPPESTKGPRTITRLLGELDTSIEDNEVPPDGAPSGRSPAAERPAALPTHIEQLGHEPGPSLRAVLVATDGPAKGDTYVIPVEGATVGRLPENAVCLPDDRLSREHARIEFRDGRFWLRDLGSRNGTALNGNLISCPQSLSNGDTIELGSNTLVVTIEPTPTATPEISS